MSQADLEISVFHRSADDYGVTLRFRHPAAGQDKSASGLLALNEAALRQHQHDAAAYGEALAAQVFAGEGVRSFLDQALAVTASQQTPLHLRLFIAPDAAALHGLRWETLRLPGSAAPLAAGEWVRFSRYLDSAGWRPARTVERNALAALVAVASPDVSGTTLAEVRTEDELAAARAGLGDIPFTAQAGRGQVTLATLLARLRAGCDILYLVAHGMVVDGEPQILLEKEDGGRAWTSGRELAARLGELANPPSLAVLVSCQSAGTGNAAIEGMDGGALAGLGPRLAAAGVPAVVAMQGNLTMDTAAVFMPTFLRELRRDGVVDRAMSVARGAVRARADWWMPVLYTRLADGRVLDLPNAADDPLFDLPPLPQLDLPEKPFHYLNWYRREDAEIFFGRGKEIRSLFDRVIAPDGEPIILLYGQSGVGKSSVLAAGLRPRLEASHDVRYMRRDRARGLLGTLAAGLPVEPDDDLASAWRRLEAQCGKPLLVVLDQVEEFFTRPNPEQPGELTEFLGALEQLFGDASRRPRGRLLLGFRKEWLAEIDKRLAERALPRAGVFLERLGRDGIAEVVAGPTSRPRLRGRYGLSVTDALPGMIADDLLADRESPVAPMLAILLADMWDAAKDRSYDRPLFNEDLYHEFRTRGLSLNDFLGRQLAALRNELPEVVDSGLALDLLAYHTTPLGTAEQRPMADLQQTYSHRLDVLPGLVQQCQDLYLLVDPAKNQPGQSPASRLTHDTLAPHVRKRFDESEKPGQRARRILESRAVDWGNNTTDVSLDDIDLEVVERGMVGMRSWLTPESELVDTSRMARQRRADQRRLRRFQGIVAAASIAVVIMIAGFLAQRWTITRKAEAIATAERLAWSAKDVARRDPELALLLAIEAATAHQSWVTDDALRTTIQVFYGSDAVPIPDVFFESWSPDSRYVVGEQGDESAAVYSTKTGDLVECLEAQGHYSEVIPSAPSEELLFPNGDILDLGPPRRRSPIDDWSPDGKYLAVLRDHTTAELWDTQTWIVTTTLPGHSDDITEASWNPEGTQIATASNDSTTRLWSAPTGELIRVLRGHTGAIKDVEWSPAGERLATASLDKTVRVWNTINGQEEIALEHDEPQGSVIWDPTGRLLLSIDLGSSTPEAKQRSNIHVWDTRSEAKVMELLPSSGSLLPSTVVWSPSGAFLAAASDDYQTTYVWNVDDWSMHTISGTSPRWSPIDDSLLVQRADRVSVVAIWNIKTLKEVARFTRHNGAVYDAEWDERGKLIASTAADSTLRIWDSTTGDQLFVIATGEEGRNWVAWDPIGFQVASLLQSQGFKVYDLTIGQEPSRFCQGVGRNMSEDDWRTYMGDQKYRKTCPGKPIPGLDIPLKPTPGSVG